MKKPFWLLALLALCCACVLGMVACDEPETTTDGGENPPAHEHSFSNEAPLAQYLKSEANCQSPALYYKSCACGEVGEETFSVGEIGGHKYEIMSTEERFFVSEATCTEYALYHFSCICGEIGEETFPYGELAEHSFNDGYTCASCGWEKSSDGLLFEYNDWHNVYTLVGYEGELGEELYISNTYNGAPINSIGTGAFKNCTTLKRVYISDQVSGIGQEAFDGCENLESIYIGKKVSSIGDHALRGCSALESIEISKENTAYTSVGNCILTEETLRYEDGSEETVTVLVAGCKTSVIPQDAGIVIIAYDAFRGVTGLTSIVIPDTVREIGTNAFDGCTDLKHVSVGTGIKYLNNYAFANCTALETIYYNVVDMVTIWDDTIFMNAGIDGEGVTLTIGKDVRVIPDDLFSSCYVVAEERWTYHKITEVVFEDDCVVETIGRRAFEEAIYLRSICLPYSVKLVYENAFKGCTSLTSVTIGYGVTSIPESCFEGCTALTDILFGGVTELGARSFAGCTALEYLSLPEGIAAIGGGAFTGCTSLRYVGIPNTVTVIDYGAFSYCDGLAEIYFNAPNVPDFYDGTSDTGVFFLSGIGVNGVSVTIGKDVVRIPAYFADTLDVRTLSWEAGTTCESIGTSAFVRCRRLLKVTLPASLKAVEADAFPYYVVEVYNFSALDVSTIESLAYGVLYVHTSLPSASKLVYDGDLVFFVNGSDCRLVGYLGTETALVLPEYCEGRTYTIDARAFGDVQTSVTEVVIPGTVARIDESAFAFSSIKTVTIKAGVAEIGSKAFNLDTVIYCEEPYRPDGWVWVEDVEQRYWSWCTPECTVYWYSASAPVTEGNFWRYVDGVPTAW